MGAIHALLSDAKRSGHIKQMPEFPGFKGSEAIEQKAPEWIGKEAQEVILSNIDPADRFIFRFIFYTGCRPSEARSFRWKDIKPDYIIFRVTFGPADELKPIKNKKQRRFPITGELAELFASMPRNLTPFCFINSHTGNHYTKNINRDFWNPASIKAGISIPLNNGGRHSFANQLLEATDNISLVQWALGHSAIGVTKRHYGDHSLESARRIMNNIRPLEKHKQMMSNENKSK
jgi:integrase